MKRVALVLSVAGALCASVPAVAVPESVAGVQSGPSADFPVASVSRAPVDYQIGPLDKISITVFQEPDLSLKDVQVEASGQILLPLIGAVQASGKTSSELAREIAARLGERYLQSPQVSVLVSGSVSQRVTVEGQVREPGIYEIQGQTTLLQALAMAKGPSQVAADRNVVIFRVLQGKRMGARFDIADIRSGKANDPQIVGNDIVVVGLSRIKAFWRDVLTTAPLFAVFRPFG